MSNSEKELLTNIKKLEPSTILYYILEEIVEFTPSEKAVLLKYVIVPWLKNHCLQSEEAEHALAILLNFLKPTAITK